jgi:pilus assembly protein CpaC
VNKHLRNAAWAMAASTAAAGLAHAATAAAANAPVGALTAKHCTSVVQTETSFVMLGKSSVIPLVAPVSRIIVSGQPAGGLGRSPTSSPEKMAAVPPPSPESNDAASVGDMEVILLSPTDLFLRGKKAGTTNVILQDTRGVCYVRDIVVSIDPATLQNKLAEMMPDETGVRVKSADNAIVLTGKVSDAANLDEILRLATAYGDGKRVVNLLRVMAPQQVMLEVKIAEVSKTLLDTFDINFSRIFTSADGLTSRVISGILGGGSAVLGQFKPNIAGGNIIGNAASTISGGSAATGASLNTISRGSTLFGIDAQKKDGLVRILAEPNIMAISGQSASFLSGGKIFIPVAQSRDAGGSIITLEEKEFGVGLKFSPTVLDGTRVNLKLVSEVSELSQTGSPFTTVGGVTSVLPSITTRRVDTTVQLNDGQSFAIAGLIGNNVTETLKRFPGLGDIPVIGMLFRSTEFQKDQTELIFVVTPRLVKASNGPIILPTDKHAEPSRSDVIFMGSAEGRPAAGSASKPTN